MEAANFEAAAQDNVMIEARRPLVVGVVVVPKADIERHGGKCSAGDDRAQTGPQSPAAASPMRFPAARLLGKQAAIARMGGVSICRIFAVRRRPFCLSH